MELLQQLIELLQEENRKCHEIGKHYADKKERPRFRNYCGAYTNAIMIAKDLLKKNNLE